MKNKIFKIIILALAILLCTCLFACTYGSDTDIESGNTDTEVGGTNIDSGNTDTESGNKDTSTETGNKDTSTDTNGEGTDAGYFVASIEENKYLTAYPYVGDASVPKELEGVYYSADAPGGNPQDDGTGKIWLTLETMPSYMISNIRIAGEYSSVENVGRSVYCIHGVKSDLTVSAAISTLPTSGEKVFLDYGYGISENGTLTVTWQENPEELLRYVELKYSSKDGEKFTEYVDGSLGKIDLIDMTENEIYSVSIRAIGSKRSGKSYEFKCSYMTGPKDVSFPRVEITTENYVWPEFENATGKPSGCWGAGITNAFYEGCTVTIYDKNNGILYTSPQKTSDDFTGAGLKIRGNTSATSASNQRYPYKIKLDEKADLLHGLVEREQKEGYSDKNWLLLNYGNYDYRAVGDAIADAVGTQWSPDYAYVSLYVNGDYRGLYVLSESVKEGNGEGEEQWRVPVRDSGYVFECDAYWWNEEFSFSTPLTENTPMHFTLKYPDPDKLPEDSGQVAYLVDYLTRFEEALMKNDDSYLDYIDLDSFVKWLLVSDYLSINDGGGCNLFLYKEDATDQTKLKMGPNWDFDSYKGGVDALAVIRLSWDTAPFYYQYLIKKPSFDARYRELFASTHGILEEYINEAFDKIDISAHYELVKYDNKRFGSSLKTLTQRKDSFLDFLKDHIEWMKTKFE